MDSPSYRSFLVRLWREPAATGPWRGEVESIQSGQTVTAESLDTTLEIIRQAIANSQSPAVPTPGSDRGLPATEGATG
ncbi:MAG: hypothetical protein AVDCRST_MAG26-3194 [uncultured Chloroflexia bacterium]|uniref:Uncharacterized protein n=1 Tax=uncultured Chloroflexia bacterium TaxID=1672391 RepID=A0A6J4JG63_9CHLR|nr:MAG: hypothetical protein AVDCRST_MAG26-3194 [uncultured Chloroflexia bacterium]